MKRRVIAEFLDNGKVKRFDFTIGNVSSEVTQDDLTKLAARFAFLRGAKLLSAEFADVEGDNCHAD